MLQRKQKWRNQLTRMQSPVSVWCSLVILCVLKKILSANLGQVGAHRPTLPPEIEDMVIDLVGEEASTKGLRSASKENRRRLRVCSLVCRRWRVRTARQKFRHVFLSESRDGKPIDFFEAIDNNVVRRYDFCRLLKHNPSIGEYVQNLELEIPYIPEDDEVQDDETTKEDRIFLKICEAVTPVTSLRLIFPFFFPPLNPLQYNFKKHPLLHRGVCKLLRTEHLQELDLHAGILYTSYLENMPNLESLTLRDVERVVVNYRPEKWTFRPSLKKLALASTASAPMEKMRQDARFRTLFASVQEFDVDISLSLSLQWGDTLNWENLRSLCATTRFPNIRVSIQSLVLLLFESMFIKFARVRQRFILLVPSSAPVILQKPSVAFL